MTKSIILVGGGGHCRSCIDVIELTGEYCIVGIVDTPDMLHTRVLGYDVIGTDADIPVLARKYDCFLITVGQIKSSEVRIRLFTLLKEHNAALPVIVSPLAHVSRHAEIGEGTIVMHHALVNAGAKIKANCIINSKALIEHDAEIGDHCHISTGALVNGGVKIGSGTFLGSSAVCRDGITVAGNSVIKSNTTVMQSTID